MHYQHITDFLYKEEADKLEKYLEKEIPWQVVRYYKPERGYVVTPRETWVAGFHQNKFYPLYNNDYDPNPIPNFLVPLKELVEEELKTNFNFMLFTKYRNEQDSITFHSDDEKFLGPNPTIASITIGFTRDFLLKEKSTGNIESFNLQHGDLFVMQNNCQSDYQHAIKKQKHRCYPRYSITFRKALNEAGSKNYYKYNTMPLSKLIF
jgi:alkylated DNA repair dioxygenase AlkB